MRVVEWPTSKETEWKSDLMTMKVKEMEGPLKSGKCGKAFNCESRQRKTQRSF